MNRSTTPVTVKAGRGHRSVRLLLAVTLAFLGILGGTTVAQAAMVNGAIKTLTVTNAAGQDVDTVIAGSRVRTNITWCAPTGTKTGDTFTLSLPKQVNGYPTSFDLKDDDGNVVATAAITGPVDSPLATFTFTNYVEQQQNVCGDAFFDGTARGTTANLGDQTLTYVTNDGTRFTKDVTIVARPIDRTKPLKVGTFNRTDQCRSNGSACINWRVQTTEGPDTNVVLQDTIGTGSTTSGQTFICSSLKVLVGDPSNSYPYITNTAAFSNYTVVNCSTSAFQVRVNSVPDGKIVQVAIDVNAPVSPVGGTSYYNTVKETSTQHPGGVSYTGSMVSASAGGSGNGDYITITKWATADGPDDGAYDTAPGKKVGNGDAVPVTMTIVNNGQNVLRNVTVSDTTQSGEDLTGLVCTFPDSSTGTTWAGPFVIGGTFTCTGTIPKVVGGVQHTDTARVDATGNGPVKDDNPFYATVEPPTPTPTPTPTEPTPTPTETPTEPTPTPTETPTEPTPTPTQTTETPTPTPSETTQTPSPTPSTSTTTAPPKPTPSKSPDGSNGHHYTINSGQPGGGGGLTSPVGLAVGVVLIAVAAGLALLWRRRSHGAE